MAQPPFSLSDPSVLTAAQILERTHRVPMPTDLALPLPPMPLAYRVIKRIIDVVVSATVLVLASPILAVTALAIVATSRGPVLFRQQRVGEGGRIFTMYKFRSMRQDSDDSLHQLAYQQFMQGKGGNGKVTTEAMELAGITAEGHEAAVDCNALIPRNWMQRQLHKLRPLLGAEDPRITPIGALIRVTSIDELPQLYNVLIGDMTLVGPRPPIPYEVRMYNRKHLLRLTVCPGVTGIWQVEGRNRVPFEQMVDMDIHYIMHRSLRVDLKLLLVTVPAVVASRAK